MAYYDPQKKSEIIVNAIPVSLGAIFVQNGRVVPYASKALTDTESRYSQTEREALAVVLGCEHYDMYVRGSPQFTVITDHKAERETTPENREMEFTTTTAVQIHHQVSPRKRQSCRLHIQASG